MRLMRCSQTGAGAGASCEGSPRGGSASIKSSSCCTAIVVTLAGLSGVCLAGRDFGCGCGCWHQGLAAAAGADGAGAGDGEEDGAAELLLALEPSPEDLDSDGLASEAAGLASVEGVESLDDSPELAGLAEE